LQQASFFRVEDAERRFNLLCCCPSRTFELQSSTYHSMKRSTSCSTVLMFTPKWLGLISQTKANTKNMSRHSFYI